MYQVNNPGGPYDNLVDSQGSEEENPKQVILFSMDEEEAYYVDKPKAIKDRDKTPSDEDNHMDESEMIN